MILDKETGVRYPCAKHIGGDIVVDGKGTLAQSHEVVKVLPNKQLMMSPIPNILWGTDAWARGAKEYDRDALGNIKRLTRLRQRRKILKL